MADYKLGYTADEIDALLDKVKNGNTLDLDEWGIGGTIAGLIQLGGGMQGVESSADDPHWVKFREQNPNSITLMFNGLPVECYIATKIVVEDYAYFGFKAFIVMGEEIAEVTVGVQHVGLNAGADLIQWETVVLVQL